MLKISKQHFIRNGVIMLTITALICGALLISLMSENIKIVNQDRSEERRVGKECR